jgi:hypothetical protein
MEINAISFIYAIVPGNDVISNELCFNRCGAKFRNAETRAASYEPSPGNSFKHLVALQHKGSQLVARS